MTIVGGTFAPPISTVELEALVLGERPERALDVVADVAERDVGRLHVHLPGLDLREVEDVVDQVEQVGARLVDRLRELDLLVGEVPVGVLRRAASRG